MRVLHTSDWHIGRKFERVSLEADQRLFLQWLARTVEEQRVDLVVIAGDIYDRSMPSEDAVELLDEGLDLLRASNVTVALISGNHDSATRIGFGARRQAAGGVHVFSKVQSSPEPWLFTKGVEKLIVLGIPFLDAYTAPAPRPNDKGENRPRTHENVLADAIADGREAVAELGALPTLVMAHTFVRGSTSSESEKQLSIGGSDAVPSNLFDGFDYVALGHLHRPQKIDGRDHIAYSGSPLPYSYSEDHEKSVRIVTFEDGALTSVEIVPIPVGRPVITLTDTLDNLLRGSEYGRYENHWVAVRLTDAVPQVQPMDRLRIRFPFVTTIRHGSIRSYKVASISARDEQLPIRTHEDVVNEFLTELLAEPPSELQKELVHEAVEASLRKDLV